MLVDGDPAALGPALAWAGRHGDGEVHLLVHDDQRDGSGILARRASAWARPPVVWRVDGRTLVLAEPAVATPPPPVAEGAMALAGLLAAHGADPVVEAGHLIGEVLGLEVARAVPDGPGWRLEVGVGRFDREARAELWPDQSAGAALDQAVATIRAWRRPGAPSHPANTLARERWLRSLVVAAPDLVDAAELRPAPPTVAQPDLRRPQPAPAVGIGRSGEPLVVVCSTSVDLDLVPAGADVRLVEGGGAYAEARLVLVVPEGDDLPVTYRLAAGLRRPARLVTVPRDWAEGGALPAAGARRRSDPGGGPAGRL